MGYTAGPEAGLEVIEAVVAAGRLAHYPHLHAVHADLLERVGRHAEAVQAFERADRRTRM